MVWGAGATAALVERASDDRDQSAVQTHREALARLVETRSTLSGTAFQPSGRTTPPRRPRPLSSGPSRVEPRELRPDRPLEGGGRGVRRSRSGLGAAGVDVAARIGGADRVRRSGHRGGGSAPRVLEYALQENAIPLRNRVHERGQRPHLLDISEDSACRRGALAFTGLTAREHEVLAHLVANRTNAEIAASLFISKKTGGAHVQPVAQDRNWLTPKSRRTGLMRRMGHQRMRCPVIGLATPAGHARVPPTYPGFARPVFSRVAGHVSQAWHALDLHSVPFAMRRSGVRIPSAPPIENAI